MKFGGGESEGGAGIHFPPTPFLFARPSGLVSDAPQARHHSGFRSKNVRASFSNCDQIMFKFFSKNFLWESGAAEGKRDRTRLKRGPVQCRKCGSISFRGRWHRPSDKIVPGLKREKEIETALCPACSMVQEEKYLGELIIENIPETKKEELINLIKKFCNLSFEENPINRLISLEEIARGMARVLVTDKRMVKRLSDKLKKVYKLKAKIIHSPREHFVRIRLVFSPALV